MDRGPERRFIHDMSSTRSHLYWRRIELLQLIGDIINRKSELSNNMLRSVRHPTDLVRFYLWSPYESLSQLWSIVKGLKTASWRNFLHELKSEVFFWMKLISRFDLFLTRPKSFHIEKVISSSERLRKMVAPMHTISRAAARIQRSSSLGNLVIAAYG
jgi:hypothetical protein